MLSPCENSTHSLHCTTHFLNSGKLCSKSVQIKMAPVINPEQAPASSVFVHTEKW